MFSALNRIIVFPAICLMMGLHLFNISVDVPDKSSEFYAENLSYNDQESIIEFFVEKILGFKDAFTEYDDVDHEKESNSSNILHFFLNHNHFDLNDCLSLAETDKKGYHYPFLTLSRPFLEIPSPPPDIV